MNKERCMKDLKKTLLRGGGVERRIVDNPESVRSLLRVALEITGLDIKEGHKELTHIADCTLNAINSMKFNEEGRNIGQDIGLYNKDIKSIRRVLDKAKANPTAGSCIRLEQIVRGLGGIMSILSKERNGNGGQGQNDDFLPHDGRGAAAPLTKG